MGKWCTLIAPGLTPLDFGCGVTLKRMCTDRTLHAHQMNFDEESLLHTVSEEKKYHGERLDR